MQSGVGSAPFKDAFDVGFMTCTNENVLARFDLAVRYVGCFPAGDILCLSYASDLALICVMRLCLLATILTGQAEHLFYLIV